MCAIISGGRRVAFVCLVLLSPLFATTVMAQERPCDDFVALLPADVVLDQLDRRVAGAEYRINRRKTLRVHGVDSLRLNGRVADARLDVTLLRRWRRDAHGTVDIRAQLDLGGCRVRVDARNQAISVRGEVCLANPEVTRVSLSRTLGIGEAVYRWVANLMIPNRFCARVDERI